MIPASTPNEKFKLTQFYKRSAIPRIYSMASEWRWLHAKLCRLPATPSESFPHMHMHFSPRGYAASHNCRPPGENALIFPRRAKLVRSSVALRGTMHVHMCTHIHMHVDEAGVPIAPVQGPAVGRKIFIWRYIVVEGGSTKAG